MHASLPLTLVLAVALLATYAGAVAVGCAPVTATLSQIGLLDTGYSATAGLINADTFQDVIVVSELGGSVVWFANQNAYGWTGPFTISTGLVTPRRLVVFDDGAGDGDVDAIAPSESFADFTIEMYLNDGTGSFTIVPVHGSTPFAGSGKIDYVQVGDLDGDGDTDVVAMADHTFFVFERTGASSFGAPSSLAFAYPDTKVFLLTDMNNDGDVDILGGGDDGPSPVYWLERTTALTFSSTVNMVFTGPATFDEVVGLYHADFDGDGILDVVAAAESDPILWAHGLSAAGTSWDPYRVVSLAFFDKPSFIDVGDIDGDGDLDIVVGTSGNNIAGWVPNLASAPPAPPTPLDNLWGTPRVIAGCDACTATFLFDVNNDGQLEVGLSDAVLDQLLYARNSPIDVLGNIVIDIFAGTPTRMPGYDLDGDGDTDLLYVSPSTSSVKWAENTNGLGGTFSTRPLDSSFIGATYAAAADLDASGSFDVLVSTDTPPSIVYALNGGLGSFPSAATPDWRLVGATPTADAATFTPVDTNGDGDVDVVGHTLTTLFYITSLYADFGNGTLAFEAAVTVDTFSSVYSSVVDNVDNDAYPDAVVVDRTPDDVYIYFGSAAGTYSSGASATVTSSLSAVFSVALLDVDSDGDLDVVLATDSSFWYVTNLGNGVFNSGGGGRTMFAADAAFDSPRNLQVLDYDGDGIDDVVYLGRTTPSPPAPPVLGYFKGDGAGSFSLVVISSGAFSFTLSSGVDLNQDGTMDGVAVANGNMGWFKGSTLFAVNPSVAPKFRPIRRAALATLANLADIISLASGCASDSVSLPPGVLITGCFSAAPYPVYKSMVIDGNGAVIDCSINGGGGVFDIREGAQVTLRNITIIGATATPKRSSGASGLRVTGAGTKLVLEDVTIRDSSAIPATGAVFQLNRGAGGAVLVESGATLIGRRVRFEGNTALTGGGAIAVLGTNVVVDLQDAVFVNNKVTAGAGGALLVGLNAAGTGSVVLTDVVVESNTALGSGASGGGIAYRCSSSVDCALNATRVTLRSNVAAVAGGGLSVRGLDVATTLVDATFDGNSAAYGGAFAATPAATTVPVTGVVSALVEPGTAATPASQVTFSGGATVMTGNSASFGGAALVCSVPVVFANATGGGLVVTGNTASVAGGGVFVCLPSGALAAGVSARVAPDDVPWVSFGGSGASASGVFGSSSAGSWGGVVASPPHVIEWTSTGSATATPVTLSSGRTFGDSATVAVIDLFTQAVFDPALQLALSITSPATGYVLTGGDRVKSMFAATVSFAASSISAESAEILGATPETVMSVSAQPSVATPAATLAATLVACGPGEGRRSLDGRPIECGTCPEGTFSAETSTAACVACPTGAFNLGTGQTECSVCPTGAFRDLNLLNTSAEIDVPCVCKAGFYAPNGVPNEPCAVCPVGGVCVGGVAAPHAAEGYYPGGDGVFLECPRRGACRGGSPFQCSVGYSAKLCSECAPGYFNLSGACKKCANTTELVLLLMVVLSFVLVFALVYFNTRKALSYRFAAAMIGLNSLQISAIYGRVDLEWGAFADAWFSAISFLNLNFDLASPECSSSSVDVYMLKWWGTMVLPVLFVIPFGVVSGLWVVWIKRQGGKREAAAARAAERGGEDSEGDDEPLTIEALKDAVIRSYYQLLVLLYLPLTGMCMSYFGCRKAEDGEWVLDAAPSRPCFNGAYWAVFPFAFIFFFLYAVAIPGGIFWLLKKREGEAQEDESGLGLALFQLRYGFLVARFDEDHFFFEVFIMLRKFGVVFMTTFFYTAVTKANAAVLVLGASFIQLCLMAPYLSRFHNILAMLCLGSCAAVLEGGTIEDDVFRGIVVVTAILVNTGVIFVGNGIDLWLMRKAETEAEEEFYQPGTMRVAGDGKMVDDEAVMSGALGTMTHDTTLDLGDGSAGGGPGSGVYALGTAGGSSGSTGLDSATCIDSAMFSGSNFQTGPGSGSSVNGSVHGSVAYGLAESEAAVMVPQPSPINPVFLESQQ